MRFLECFRARLKIKMTILEDILEFKDRLGAHSAGRQQPLVIVLPEDLYLKVCDELRRKYPIEPNNSSGLGPIKYFHTLGQIEIQCAPRFVFDMNVFSERNK